MKFCEILGCQIKNRACVVWLFFACRNHQNPSNCPVKKKEKTLTAIRFGMAKINLDIELLKLSVADLSIDRKKSRVKVPIL